MEEPQFFFWKINKSLVVPPAQVGVIHTHRAQGGSQIGSPDFGNSSPFPQGSSVRPQQIPRFSQQTWGEFYFNFCGFFFINSSRLWCVCGASCHQVDLRVGMVPKSHTKWVFFGGRSKGVFLPDVPINSGQDGIMGWA